MTSEPGLIFLEIWGPDVLLGSCLFPIPGSRAFPITTIRDPFRNEQITGDHPVPPTHWDPHKPITDIC